MFTNEQFDGLEVGDLVETSIVFKGLPTDEVVVLHTAKKEKDRAEFIVTYFGVTLGRWYCTRKKGELTWKFE